MIIYKPFLPLVLLSLVAGVAFAVNAPGSPDVVTTPVPVVATPAIPGTTPGPGVGVGFTADSPVNFDPSKFGSLTTSTLPVADGKRLVGKVNGQPLSLDDFLITFEVSAATLLKQNPENRDGVMAALAAPVFDGLVSTALYREFAKKHSLVVSPAEAKRKTGEIIGQSAGPGKEALQRLTQDQLLTLATDTLVREKVEKFIGDRATSVPPTLDEITSVAATALAPITTAPKETLRARHIVIRATPDMSEFNINDARAKAEDILVKVRGGIDFATAARQYSQDRFTAYLGGNVGYFTRGTMFKEFEDAAFALQPGDISGIVRTPVGFHIIQVTERHPDNLRILIDELRRLHAVDAWKREALRSAKIENYLTK